MATSPSSLPEPQKSNSAAAQYPSPPNSPRQAKPPAPEAPNVSEDEARPAGPVVSLTLRGPPGAPPRHSFASTAYDEPEENKDDVSELKTRLGLDSGLCGGPTKPGPPCRNLSPAANKAHIASQLKLMTDLTQSSPGLSPALDKLAMLVHCRHHDVGAPKESRIDAWMTEFPVVGEAGIADPTASVEKQIRKLLDLVSTQCIGVVPGKQPRCGKKIGGQRVQNCAATIAKIIRPEVHLNDVYLDGFLRVLETNMFCSLSHINRQPLRTVAIWRSEIGEILEKQLAKPPVGLGRDDAPESMMSSSRPPNIQSPERAATETGDSSARGLFTIPNFRGDLSTYWPKAYDTSPFDIIQKSDGPTDPEPLYVSIKNMMMKELENSPRSGYVYAYEVQGNSGYVKIGYTAGSVEERLEEWEYECNRVPKVLYPMPSDTIAVVPNARRVEALCHTELDRRRIRLYCKCCLKQHLEWFEVSAAEAVVVIQKWSMWMATRPYYLSRESRSVEKWTMRDEVKKTTEDMGCFMRKILEALGPTSGSGLKVDDIKVKVVQGSMSSTDCRDSQSPS